MAMKPSSKFERMNPAKLAAKKSSGGVAGFVKDVVTNPLGSINKKTATAAKNVATNPLGYMQGKTDARKQILKKRAGM